MFFLGFDVVPHKFPIKIFLYRIFAYLSFFDGGHGARLVKNKISSILTRILQFEIK